MRESNYTDVLDQLRAHGLVVEDLRIGTDRVVRCKVEGDREKRGWYRLHELHTERGDRIIVGSFGIWQGDDPGARKIEIRKTPITPEQQAALAKRIKEDRRRADEAVRRQHDECARRAHSAWLKYSSEGDSDYLITKGVGAYGVRFTPHGSVVVPLHDTAGRIHGLQIIRPASLAKEQRKLAKQFWPEGLAKQGHFHLIGAPTWIILLAEGYATAATLHMATGLPVAATFDAGNLAPVARELRKRYRQAKILVCADDDAFGKCKACQAPIVLPEVDGPKCPACGEDHRVVNTGVNAASAVALEVQNSAWVRPVFAGEQKRRDLYLANGHKHTDFNDLQQHDSGLPTVRAQIEGRLGELGWREPSRGASNSPSGVGGGEKLRPIQYLDELLTRYSLVYAHSGAVFDASEHILLSLSDMRDACIRKDLHKAWSEHPDKNIVRIREVGFDPGGQDPQITCNLFGGWPTSPKSGDCSKLLELLRYMCSEDPHGDRLYDWVLKWIAYPLQHPGAKMKSTLVLHGPQGAGKNMFFEALMAIYGEYGDVIDQSAIEDKFNDWASRKLFLIADEVVARSDLYHVKNKLKALITGDRIRINPKNFAAYWERNHVNLVFLSNEAMPVVLEEDDRRHCVIWTPSKRPLEYYHAVLHEIRSGGVEALHDYLLHLDLGDFDAGAMPPQTHAKNELIHLALDSPIRFHDELLSKDIRGLKPLTALAQDWFDAYKLWCTRTNNRAAPMPKFINALTKKRYVKAERERYLIGQTEHGPHSILFLGGQDHPEGSHRKIWLGEQIETFRDAVLSDYKGSSS